MVLSNKKLKQKIRAQLTGSLTSSPENITDSFKSLLDSLTQKPRLSKRDKRRVISSSENQEKGLDVKKQKKRKREVEGEKKDDGEIVVSDGLKDGVKKENKREVDGEEKVVGEKKLKSKKKKKKNKKGKKNKEDEKKDGDIVNGEDTVAEIIKATDSQENADVSTKVYVGGIPYYSSEEDICSFFESCGTITEVDCMRFPDTGKFRGIAFISFKTEAAAKRALALDGADMGGLFLKIQPCKTTIEKKVSDFSPAIVEGYNRIYVGNLSWDITEEDLRSFFADFSVSSIRFGEDKETKEFRGYAHVDFTDSLFVTMALTLDQKILCGRPVRIRCAVPAKKAESNAKLIPTSKNVENLELRTDDVDTSAVSGKIRRRTCYECGEKGHLTSSCPKKQAADSIQSIPSKIDDITANVEAIPDNVKTITISRKITGTCFECGEKGHLISSCPNKQIAAPTIYVPTNRNANTIGLNANNAEAGTVSGKIRRRTCYECGEKGHLSSLCPNKQPVDSMKSVPPPADSMKSVPASKNAYNDETSTYNVPVKRNNVSAEANNVSVDASTVSGKIRRRTCYECGEKGHLSSSCPKKQALDLVPPIAS